MRPIKFRAWDIKRKQWREDINISLSGVLFDEYNNAAENVEIVQFTGLLEKNGKEIYEGDILKMGGSKFLYWVDYQYAEFVLMYGDSGDYKTFLDFKSDVQNDGTVIGNIYENPELLKK